MPRAPEVIPDDAVVCRHIIAPKMGADKDSLLLSEFIVFEKNKEPPPRFYGESLVWTAYAKPVPARVHALGIEVEARRKERGKPAAYLGFIATHAGQIRSFKNPSGKGFTVEDSPNEGDHHVEVRLDVAPGVPFPSLEKAEIQLSLAKLFSPLVPIDHS